MMIRLPKCYLKWNRTYCDSKWKKPNKKKVTSRLFFCPLCLRLWSSKMRMLFFGAVLSCSLHRFASFYLSFSRVWYLESFCLRNTPRFSWYLQNVQRERRSPNCTSNCVRFVHFDNDAIMMGSANVMRKKRLFDMHLSIKLSNSIMSSDVVRATLVCANRSDRLGQLI